MFAEFRCGDTYTEISCQLLLAELCKNIENDNIYLPEHNPLWLISLIEIIHFSNGPFTLKSLSERLGIHPNHLSRAIPKYFSTTLGDYIRQVKIKKAINFMLSSKKSLLDISFECGFSDHSHFSRTFKRYIGTTPKDFYKKCRSC